MIALYFAIAALVVAVDQLTKYLIVTNVKPQGSSGFIPHLLSFVYSENRGVAFGLFQDATWLFIVLTSIVIVVFLFLLIKYYKTGKLFSIASALIIGGGIGNLIDRIRLGYVVDFLKFQFIDFPIFNIADCFITVGAVMFAIYVIFLNEKKEQTDGNDEGRADG